MQTEYGATLAKDFDFNALKQIRDASIKRKEWCEEEASRRSTMPGQWSFQDINDLRADATSYAKLADALWEIINA